MSDYPGGVVHVSSSSFCCIAALIGCQMSWHHCTHEEGVAALRKWGNVGTVCCCTVPVVDFEGRYRFGCLSTAKSVKEGIIERDFPPTSKIIEYIYIYYIDVFTLMRLPLGNHYWFGSLPNIQDTLVEVICDINLYSSANIFQFQGCFSIEYVEQFFCEMNNDKNLGLFKAYGGYIVLPSYIVRLRYFITSNIWGSQFFSRKTRISFGK